MKNKNLQDLLDKVIQEEKNEINSLDDYSSHLIKGGYDELSLDDDGCSKLKGCSKIKN
ncbi:hypothetical protein [Chitinophaga sancti]|uniref:Uncharacterized protein n=1 Tax=Chitinophaga sancti TaxID=1004 RepID=A0A1K1SPM6_9BACT|nr:hypothetical protein [Chitinophaga sancti]WQD64426.1 hypothetical protein U0033_08455 [Chitinophaga sancti]WQG89950.1 hypothetical protein SR876_00465 [Chitinophaga sancti]SFW86273.1 hypothetical protein SAMN05661012_05875 [Chitinophaga sancti]